ncbi:signal peptidase I [Bryocella elongata]|uniref:Signal peptidase I n=2 Tax=Bryocella elongata TaxID=863522 RepID=A0A1H6BRX5_9BACT|nr:signal peptidase I [Bryocella elongata]
MVRSLAEMLIIALFLLTFVIQPFRIPSASMQPTLNVGDFLLVDKRSYAAEGRLGSMLLPATPVHRGDLAVFLFPPDPSRHLVKRVIGLPGDRIRLRDGRVLVNGQPISESYAVYAPSRPNLFRDEFPNLREADPDVDEHWWLMLRRSIVGADVVVPPDHYFVLGDNRNNSEDSRYWGFVPQANMVGRPLVVYFSTSWKSGQTAEARQFEPTPPPPASTLGRLGKVLGDGFRAARILR